MRKRFSELNFIIGVFFFIISLILLIGFLTSRILSARINLYTGLIFLLFGLGMIFIKGRRPGER